MERTIYSLHGLFVNAVILELRIFRAIGATIAAFFVGIAEFILGLDFHDRKD